MISCLAETDLARGHVESADETIFFVDPETYALVGCRFFHDEAKNDGEYLLYEGEVQGPHGLRLPKMRRWYMNSDGKYIATDDVVSIE